MRQKYKKNLSCQSSLETGFTLIELLVVISIIGLLASVVLVALNAQRINARNTKRVADVRQLVTVFNQALSTPGAQLPDPGAGIAPCISNTCYGGRAGGPFASSSAVDTFIAPYVSKPTDPKDNTRAHGGYIYGYSSTSFASGWPPYNSYTAGGWIDWVMEPSSSATSCGGVGSLYHDAGSSGVECMVSIN